MFGRIHFSEREMEGEGGLCALVFAHPILVQSIATAAGAEVVERETEIVAPEKPFEGALGLV
jgi:hypothetical protein